MGDFVPSNIIVTQDKKIVFTDFEYFCIDNSSLDLAYLWLYLWRYPDWQNELLKKYPNINQDDFQISVLRILLPLFVRKFSSNDIYSQKLYMKHKWREYLIRSAGSFDFLTKT
jgi:thiamine kinase-like enzyme